MKITKKQLRLAIKKCLTEAKLKRLLHEDTKRKTNYLFDDDTLPSSAAIMIWGSTWNWGAYKKFTAHWNDFDQVQNRFELMYQWEDLPKPALQYAIPYSLKSFYENASNNKFYDITEYEPIKALARAMSGRTTGPDISQITDTHEILEEKVEKEREKAEARKEEKRKEKERKSRQAKEKKTKMYYLFYDSPEEKKAFKKDFKDYIGDPRYDEFYRKYTSWRNSYRETQGDFETLRNQKIAELKKEMGPTISRRPADLAMIDAWKLGFTKDKRLPQIQADINAMIAKDDFDAGKLIAALTKKYKLPTTRQIKLTKKGRGRDQKTKAGKSILDYIDPSSKDTADPFRRWLNTNYKTVAKAKRGITVTFNGKKYKGLDLDVDGTRGGSNNSYVRRAWKEFGDEYLDAVGTINQAQIKTEARKLIRRAILKEINNYL